LNKNPADYLPCHTHNATPTDENDMDFNKKFVVDSAIPRALN